MTFGEIIALLSLCAMAYWLYHHGKLVREEIAEVRAMYQRLHTIVLTWQGKLTDKKP